MASEQAQTEVRLKDVRGSFLELFVPSIKGDSTAATYGACWSIVPGSKNAEVLDKAMAEVAKKKWGEKGPQILAALIEERKVGYGKFEKRSKQGEVYAGFEKMWYCNSSSDKRPTVVDRNAAPLTAADGKPYSGCYNNVHLSCWAQDNKHARRINFQLMGVQFVRDGDSFSGSRVSSVDDFADLGVDTTADDLA